jgi:hypothetical protein
VTMAEGGLMYEATVGGQKFEYEAYGDYGTTSDRAPG